MINTLIKIKPFVNDIGTLGKLGFAFINGKYRYISKKAAIGIIIAILYILNPIDLVPDFLSLFGFIDDAAVLGLIAYLLREDIEKFRDWEDKSQ